MSLAFSAQIVENSLPYLRRRGFNVQLIPRDGNFFDLFNQQTENIYKAAQQLVVLFGDFRDVEKRVAEIKSAEHQGDQITRSVMTKLNQTFITPFDREDIHALSSALDDVLDLVDAAASRLITYKVKFVTPGAVQLANVILRGSEILVKAVSELRKPQNILRYCEQLNQIEEESDRIKGECIGKLFEDSTEAIEIIKWKEIYEVLEAATDKCEDVSDVLAAVVLKSA
jgi:hypothetical protein